MSVSNEGSAAPRLEAQEAVPVQVDAEILDNGAEVPFGAAIGKLEGGDTGGACDEDAAHVPPSGEPSAVDGPSAVEVLKNKRLQAASTGAAFVSEQAAAGSKARASSATPRSKVLLDSGSFAEVQFLQAASMRSAAVVALPPHASQSVSSVGTVNVNGLHQPVLPSQTRPWRWRSRGSDATSPTRLHSVTISSAHVGLQAVWWRLLHMRATHRLVFRW